MPKVGLIIFHFWTPHFVVWTPHFGWTPRLNYTVVCACASLCLSVLSVCLCVTLCTRTRRLRKLRTRIWIRCSGLLDHRLEQTKRLFRASTRCSRAEPECLILYASRTRLGARQPLICIFRVLEPLTAINTHELYNDHGTGSADNT